MSTQQSNNAICASVDIPESHLTLYVHHSELCYVSTIEIMVSLNSILPLDCVGDFNVVQSWNYCIQTVHMRSRINYPGFSWNSENRLHATYLWQMHWTLTNQFPDEFWLQIPSTHSNEFVDYNKENAVIIKFAEKR